MKFVPFAACGLIFGSLAAACAAPCSYSLSPASASVSSSAGAGSFSVLAGSSCAWTATTTNSWIHTTSTGTGNGTVNYTLDANTASSPRVGAITGGSKTFTFVVNQQVALGVALDNTNLNWVTGADYPWFSTADPAYDGVDSAGSGNQYIADSTSWLQTTVVGPGTLSFWWKINADPSVNLEFYLGGALQDQINGMTDWLYRTYVIPPGTNVLQWQYVKVGSINVGTDRGWLDQVIYSTNPPTALQEALDTCGVSWTSGGNGNPTYWAGQTNVSHDGKSAAQSGAVYTSQESWMETSVRGVTNVSFWWKVSSQTNDDFLEFYTNGVLVRGISGAVNWQSNYFRLPPATNTLRWRYAMTSFVDPSVPFGQNCGWVDQVAFNPPLTAPPIVTVLGANPMVIECHGSFTDPGATAQDGCSGVALSVTTNGLVSPNVLGSYNLQYIATNASGNSATSTRTVNVVDTTPPQILFSFTNLTLAANGNCQAVLPDLTGTNYFIASDNCSSVTVTQTPPAGTPLSLGTNKLVLTATDASANTVSQTNELVVTDQHPPVLVCPPNVQLSADQGQCTRTNVALGAPTVSDNCGPVAVTNDAPLIFPVGTNLVTWTAADGHGNTTNCLQLVIIKDTELPVLLAPGTVTVLSDPGTNYASSVALGTPVSSDNCGLAGVTNDAPNAFPEGTNTVNWTATDIHGNVAFAAQQVVVKPRLPHRIVSIVKNGDSSFSLTFAGTAGVEFIVQISSNLLDWVSVQTNVAATDGTWTYLDSAPSVGMSRFFRSFQP